jgi:hypothetical protein
LLDPDPQPWLISFFLPEKLFSICILKNVPNFEVYAYGGNIVATETVVREPKNNIKLLGERQKTRKCTQKKEWIIRGKYQHIYKAIT